MRYAALISCCDIFDFGPYRMLSDKGRRIIYRFSDELLFALAQYIYSLEPPENPNLGDRSVAAGKKVRSRRLRRMSYSAALHQQQADVSCWIHPSEGPSASRRRSARLGWHRSQSGAQDARRDWPLQNPVTSRSVVQECAWP